MTLGSGLSAFGFDSSMFVMKDERPGTEDRERVTRAKSESPIILHASSSRRSHYLYGRLGLPSY